GVLEVDHLLPGHEDGGPQHGAAAGLAAEARLVERLGQAIVPDLDDGRTAVSGKEEVARLEVAVDQAAARAEHVVGVVEAVQRLQDERYCLRGAQRPAALFQQLVEAASIAILQREEEGAVRAAGVAQPDDVAMLKDPGACHLAKEELLGGLVGGDPRQDELEGDLLAGAVVAGQEDRSHAAAAQLAQKGV